jgi:cysteine desulfurase family protein
MIYLDNAATTFPKPECVYEAIDMANHKMAFNAGRGGYKEAKVVSDMIHETRGLIANLVGLSSENVCFESSATEALNIIINGMQFHEGDTVYVSPFEHNAIIRPLYNRKIMVNFNIETIPFDRETWELDESKLKNQFALHKPTAVFITHISNVTGYILPYEHIFELSKVYNSINVLDCSQSYGVIKPRVKDIDYIVFAGHKSLYATFGAAGFINNTNYKLNITKSGGTGSDSLNPTMPESLPLKYEAGSMNSVAIAALNESVKWLNKTDVYQHENELTGYLINKLLAVKKATLYLPKNREDVFGIVSFNISGYAPSDVGSILGDEYDICVRTGYHCSPLVHDFIGSKDMHGTVRASIGAFTQKEDIDGLVSALNTL